MKTNFEKHMEKIRTSLDTDTPDDELIWKGIEKEIVKKPNYRRMYYWSLAAIFVLLFGIGYLLVNNLRDQNMQNQYYSLGNISAELGKQQQYYLTVIASKQEQIDNAKVNKSELEYLYKNLELIAILEKQFMDDLKEMPNNDRIINSIIRNYERKIEILERILRETKKKEHYGSTIKSINL